MKWVCLIYNFIMLHLLPVLILLIFIMASVGRQGVSEPPASHTLISHLPYLFGHNYISSPFWHCPCISEQEGLKIHINLNSSSTMMYHSCCRPLIFFQISTTLACLARPGCSPEVYCIKLMSLWFYITQTWSNVYLGTLYCMQIQHIK